MSSTCESRYFLAECHRASRLGGLCDTMASSRAREGARTTACRQARRWQDWLTDGRPVSARDSFSSSVSSRAVVKQQIGYRDIQALSRAQMSGQRFLYVTHAGGQYVITAFMLPSTAVFEEVCALLAARMTCIRMG